MSSKTDEIKSKELALQLQDLGLGDKEARVYLALLPRQEVGSSKLIRATGLHGQFVYDALAKLEDRGLAKHAVVRGRKKFSANPPERILSLLKEKELMASSVVRQLTEQFAGKYEQSFEVFQGVDAVVAHEFQLLEETPEGGHVDVIGAGGSLYAGMHGEQFEEYEKRRKSRNIGVRYLSSSGQTSFLDEMSNFRFNFKSYVLPGVAQGFIDTNIWPEKVVFILFGDPVVSFAFSNKKVAEGYREFFEMLWKISSR